MNKKPMACQGCPLYNDGVGFVKDRLKGGEVTVCLPLPSKEEEALGISGRGADFMQVKDNLAPNMGVDAGEMNLTHAIRCRYRKQKGNGQWYSVEFDEMFKLRTVRAAMEHCKVHDQEIEGERLVMAMGEINHLKYGGPAANDAQYSWRGHLSPLETKG